MKNIIKDWWHEFVGYGVGFCAKAYGMLPGTYEDWTHLFALMIVAVTFIFITLPKAWDFQKKRWGKK